MKKYLYLIAIALIVAEAGCVASYARKVVAQVKADRATTEYQKEIHDLEDNIMPVRRWQL